jgi:hypothetical protein
MCGRELKIRRHPIATPPTGLICKITALAQVVNEPITRSSLRP